MFLTVPYEDWLPLTLIWTELLLILNSEVAKTADYQVIKVKFINSSQNELMDQVVRVMSGYDIPVVISTELEEIEPYTNALEVIFGDEFVFDVVRANQSNYRVYLLHTKGEFIKAMEMVKGWVLILVWNKGEVYCKNPLIGHWVHSFLLCEWPTKRNYNQRRVTVYVPTDKFSHVEQQESGVYILAGFKGILLYELKKYLNVTFQYVIQREFSNIAKSPLRQHQTFIKPLRGVYMGRINERVYVLKEDDNL